MRNYPVDVERNANAAGGAISVSHLSAKRPQAQQSNLERLQRYRNSDNGDSHCQTSREITDGSFESTE